ncbi:telomere-protecting terminal protein Tpg [Kitasatospora sp. NPDC053057]|uniref:telomere-protecting terminal protein Tpg n=1 Tax=Kitasatospora sp. NPDC053057 TaxID=3364062 RepID=UPI0037C91DC6
MSEALDRGLERAMQTQPIPKTLAGRTSFLVKQFKGTKNTARELGVSQRSVERWLKGGGIGKENAKKLEAAVRERWQPRVRKRIRRAAEANGFYVEVSGTFGFKSGKGSTDDPRDRLLPVQKLSGDVARRLFEARDRGASQQEQEKIIAEGLREAYFTDGGRRARGLEVTFTGLHWAEFSVD